MSFSKIEICDTCPLRKDYVMPKRIVWSSGATDTECLLTNRENQAFQGAHKVATISTENGEKGAILLDFGAELTGGVRFVTNVGKWNETFQVRIRFGESVSEAMHEIGEKHAANDHVTRDFVVPAFMLSTAEWGTTAFRFVYLELLTPGTKMELVSVHAMFTYRDDARLGSFSCSDPLLNDIYETAAHTGHLNMQKYLWDGVKRDRLIWAGDAAADQKCVRTVFGNHPIAGDTLRYIAKAGAKSYWNFMTAEGMSYILALYEWYFYSGDTALVEDTKDYWLDLIEKLCALMAEEPPYLSKQSFPDIFFFDWTTEGNDEATLAGLVSYFVRTLRAAAGLCRAIGERETEAFVLSKAELLKENKNHHHGIKTLVATMFDAGHLSAEETAKVLTRGGGDGMSTSAGYNILKTVARTVDVKTALSMLRQFYGAMLSVGATSFWEFFKLEWAKEGARIDTFLEEGDYDIHGDNGEFCYNGLGNSLCHGWGSTPTAFLAETVLGIEVLEAGCKTLSIHPDLADLDWAKGTYPTPFGIVSVEAKWENGEVITNISVPEGITLV